MSSGTMQDPRDEMAEWVRSALEADTQQDCIRFQRYILERAMNAINATSAYISKRDPVTRDCVVTHDAYSEDANLVERQSDLGEVYPADENPKVTAWLMMREPPRRQMHLDDFDFDDPEREEFITYGAFSVLYVPLRHRDRVWGYAEFWESRQKRHFTSQEFKIIEAYMEPFSTSLYSIHSP